MSSDGIVLDYLTSGCVYNVYSVPRRIRRELKREGWGGFIGINGRSGTTTVNKMVC